MNIERIDLNLLRVFDAVYEDRNLLRAGKRLHLSQSAVSHALARLRDALRDELFVRTPGGMEPTARAIDMALPLREALRQIRATLGVQAFVPDESERRFVIAANDYVTTVLIARLSRRLSVAASGVEIVVRPSTRLDLAAQIDIGRIDIAIGVFAEVPARLQSRPIWRQRDVLVMRKGHPIGRRRVALADLARYPLLTISLGGLEEGAVAGFIAERGLARQSEMFDRLALEDALAGLDATPRLRCVVPHSLAVPALLHDTDMLSLVPEPLALQFVRAGGVIVKALPYEVPDVSLQAVWHRRHEQEPGHVWLREQLAEVAREVAPPAGSA